ncbi:DUF4345 domain-containing protein [Kordia algicida OT-1]|uniref:DUF4345 domain-containing protein n=1 Tax=Kordia algicida OT-1 TaxID=391587 RepID=A9DPV1_9FLAO|nr:DUF4345 domain-containing protein [Kordia algicida]EDP97528.1 hypothetical protein KAOT1_20237 [Kordia algicida OT-1]
MKEIHKNLHLTLSSAAILVVGVTYGLYPDTFLPLFFDFDVKTTDLNHVFRAIMGSYFALGIYWGYAAYFQKYWRGATYSVIFFMGGLATGRLLSIFIDGIPSTAFTVGTILETVFVIWGCYNLKIYKDR